MMTTMDMHLELSDDQAYALAQFVKRCGWTEWRQNAADDASRGVSPLKSKDQQP